MKEQEVIKRLNFHKEYVRLYSSRVVMISETDLETVLNMLKEKDEQIAKYEKIYKEYDCYRWVKELERKDKIIDLIARAFKQDDVRTVEEIKKYFERKSEEC